MTGTLPAPLALSHAHALRTAELLQKSARLALTQPPPAVAQELAELGRATFDRYAAMQRDWMAQWRDWAAYAAAIEEARTLPIYAEHGMNAMVRAQKLASDQIAATMTLGENAAVSYGYWLDRRLQEG